jgi:hypothetical protein
MLIIYKIVKFDLFVNIYTAVYMTIHVQYFTIKYI